MSDADALAFDLANCTSAEVEFHIRNYAPKIQDDSVVIYAGLTGKDHEAQRHDHMSTGSGLLAN